MGYKSVIVKTFERLLAGQPPVIYGDGTQALDYVYVDDVVDALMRALTPAAHGQTFNVASGTAVTVRDLVRTMTEVAGVPDAPTFEPADWTAGTWRSGSPGPHRGGARLASPHGSPDRPAPDARLDARATRMSIELSVVAPCFNEAKNLPELVERLLRTFDRRQLAASSSWSTTEAPTTPSP